jgi:hypothetical protein
MEFCEPSSTPQFRCGRVREVKRFRRDAVKRSAWAVADGIKIRPMHRTPRSQPLPSFMRGTSKSSYLIYFHERSINVIASVFFSAWPVRKAPLSLERWCVMVLVEYLWEIFQLNQLRDADIQEFDWARSE